METKIFRSVDRIHEVYSVERDASKRIHVVREETDENSNNYSTRSSLARSAVQDWERRSKERKNRNRQSKK